MLYVRCVHFHTKSLCGRFIAVGLSGQILISMDVSHKGPQWIQYRNVYSGRVIKDGDRQGVVLYPRYIDWRTCTASTFVVEWDQDHGNKTEITCVQLVSWVQDQFAQQPWVPAQVNMVMPLHAVFMCMGHASMQTSTATCNLHCK